MGGEKIFGENLQAFFLTVSLNSAAGSITPINQQGVHDYIDYDDDVDGDDVDDDDDDYVNDDDRDDASITLMMVVIIIINDDGDDDTDDDDGSITPNDDDDDEDDGLSWLFTCSLGFSVLLSLFCIFFFFS